MENHILATQDDLDQVRLAVLQLAENLPLIHQPAPHNATQFNTFRSTIIDNMTSQLQQPSSVQVHDLLAEMTDQTRDLAHQIPLEMLETNVAALRGQVSDLQSQVNDLQSQVNGLQNQAHPALSSYIEHHIPRLNSLILGLQSQVAITVTPSIDAFNRKIAHLQVQADSAGRISDLQTAQIAAIKDDLIDVVLLKRDVAALEDSMKANQVIEKWLQTSQQTGAGQVEQGAGQASIQFPKGTPNITGAVLHHEPPLSPVVVQGKTPVSSSRASVQDNNTAMPSNEVPSNRVNISSPAALGSHHNIATTTPVHDTTAPSAIHNVHDTTVSSAVHNVHDTTASSAIHNVHDTTVSSAIHNVHDTTASSAIDNVHDTTASAAIDSVQDTTHPRGLNRVNNHIPTSAPLGSHHNIATTTPSAISNVHDTTASAAIDSVQDTTHPRGSNRVNNHIPSSAPLGSHHNIATTTPAAVSNVHDTTAPSAINSVHGITNSRGFNRVNISSPAPLGSNHNIATTTPAAVSNVHDTTAPSAINSIHGIINSRGFNRVNNHYSSQAQLASHHNIATTAPSASNSVHDTTQPRGLNPQAPSFISKYSSTSPLTNKQPSAKMANNTNDGDKGASKSGINDSMWAPKAGEKPTIGDRPYNYHVGSDSNFRTGLEASMWAPGNRGGAAAARPVPRPVPIVNPQARDEAAFLAEYNTLLNKYEFTALEGQAIISKAFYGDVERLSSK